LKQFWFKNNFIFFLFFFFFLKNDDIPGSNLREINCGCIEGYFEDSDLSCQECPESCLNCDISSCSLCVGNRVYLGVGRECTCSGIGTDHSPAFLYCTNCLVTYFTKKFTMDMSII
jgi:hypothetical protein